MLKHTFVSAAEDLPDATKLRPSNWGSGSTDYAVAPTHIFEGGALGQYLGYDPDSPDHTQWITPPSLFTQAQADALYSPLGHSHSFASLTAKPTTVGGYGITDAYTMAQVDSALGLKSDATHVQAVNKGGTNLTVYAVGDLLYASGTTTLSKLADVATGSVLVSGGVGVAPSWSATPSLTSIAFPSYGTLITGPSGLQLLRVPDQTTLVKNLYIGTGGTLTSRSGTAPVDPLATETDGSSNGLYNTFIGFGAGDANTTGNQNTFVGTNAGVVNSNGDQNTFIGFEAGQANTNGYHNTFVGIWAGYKNSTGFFNTYVGTDIAITNDATGSGNVVVGASSASLITSATSITCVGVNSMSVATSATSIVAIGRDTLQALTTGTFITAVGRGAGTAQNLGNSQPSGVGPTTANSMTLLGSRTCVQAGAEAATNCTCIGDGATINRSDQMVLGAFNVAQVKAHGDMHVIRHSTLGAEVFNNGTLTGSTNWSATGDFAIGASNAVYTHSTGTGTIAQTQANHATAVKSNRWYKFTYNVVVASQTMSATITGFGTGAPQDNWKLDLTRTGTRVLFILSNGTTFTITGTSTTAGETFTIDDLSMKEVQGGNVWVGGKLQLGSWATQTTIGANGSASALTANPKGYILVTLDGSDVIVPYYNP